MDSAAFALVERWLDKRRTVGIGPRRPLFCTLDGQLAQPPVEAVGVGVDRAAADPPPAVHHFEGLFLGRDHREPFGRRLAVLVERDHDQLARALERGADPGRARGQVGGA